MLDTSSPVGWILNLHGLQKLWFDYQSNQLIINTAGFLSIMYSKTTVTRFDRYIEEVELLCLTQASVGVLAVIWPVRSLNLITLKRIVKINFLVCCWTSHGAAKTLNILKTQLKIVGLICLASYCEMTKPFWTFSE